MFPMAPHPGAAPAAPHPVAPGAPPAAAAPTTVAAAIQAAHGHLAQLVGAVGAGLRLAEVDDAAGPAEKALRDASAMLDQVTDLLDGAGGGAGAAAPPAGPPAHALPPGH